MWRQLDSLRDVSEWSLAICLRDSITPDKMSCACVVKSRTFRSLTDGQNVLNVIGSLLDVGRQLSRDIEPQYVLNCFFAYERICPAPHPLLRVRIGLDSTYHGLC